MAGPTFWSQFIQIAIGFFMLRDWRARSWHMTWISMKCMLSRILGHAVWCHVFHMSLCMHNHWQIGIDHVTLHCLWSIYYLKMIFELYKSWVLTLTAIWLNFLELGVLFCICACFFFILVSFCSWLMWLSCKLALPRLFILGNCSNATYSVKSYFCSWICTPCEENREHIVLLLEMLLIYFSCTL